MSTFFVENKRYFLNLILFNLLFSHNLFAQNLMATEPEEPFTNNDIIFSEIQSVFSASKFEQKITEAPSWVSVITRQEIKKLGYRDFQNILDSVTGFYTSNDRNYGYAGIRGFGIPGDYNTRLLVLVNGNRINENIYSSFGADRGFKIDIDLIDRIEFVRGPSSSLYGTNAFFGVINVITRKGRDFKGMEVSGSFGSFDSKQARISYGNRLDSGMELLLSGTLYESAGDTSLYYKEFDDPANNNGFAKNADGENLTQLFAKINYEDLTLDASFSRRKKVIPTAPWETVFNTDQTYVDESIYSLVFGYQKQLSPEMLFSSKLSFSRYTYEGKYLYDWGDPDGLIANLDESIGEWVFGEISLSSIHFDSHNIIGGLEFQYDLKQNQKTYDVFEVHLDDKRKNGRWGLYLQDDIEINNYWSVNIGFRHDYYAQFGSTTNPRLAVLYHTDNSSTIKFIAGTAFRAPNAYELYYHDGYSTSKPNTELNPETIFSSELIFEKYFENAIRLVATVFMNNIDDLIVLEMDPADDLLNFKNVSTVETRGAEIEVATNRESGLSAQVGYSFQHTVDTATNNRIPNSPRHILKFNFISPNLYGFSIGLETNHQSGRLNKNNLSTDLIHLVNLTFLNNSLVKNLTASLSIYNLLDEDYVFPASEEHTQEFIPQNGRTLRLKLEYLY